MNKRPRNAPRQRSHVLRDGACLSGPSRRGASLPSARLSGRSFRRAVAVVLLAGTSLAGAWVPAVAEMAADQATKPTNNPPASAARVVSAWHPTVRMLTFQNPNSGRVWVGLGSNASPKIRELPGGVELTFAPGTKVEIPSGLKLRQVAAVDAHEVDGSTVAVVHFACDCAATITNVAATTTVESSVLLDVRENPRRADRQKPASPPNGDLDKLRNDLTAKLAVLNAPPPSVAHPPTPAPAPVAPAPVVPVAAAPGDAAPPVPAPPQICLRAVDMSHWRRDASFVSQLVDLRAQVARTHAGAPEMAELAEFYLAYALGTEALAVASDALGGDTTQEDHTRLVRDADIAHLLKGEQLDPNSPLLSSPPGCERADAALWRALADAAAQDSDGVAQAADAARIALRNVPEPLQQRLAYHIADAVGDNKAALLAMAGAVRNTEIGIPQEAAARYLLQARIAEASKDGDYATFLERAARYDLTVPGLIAKARLAALRVDQNAPDAGHSEAILADIARTYRFEAFGQRAAEHYADRRMREGDYASALAMADESAGPDHRAWEHTGASKGASLAARVLRILLVEPEKAGLPAPSERLALYWQYQGYTPPGDKGDDIRVAVARLMLAQRLPDAALGVLQQVADGTAAKPDVALLRAEAEARGGNPATALTMLQSVPDGDASHRIAADALDRMGKFTEAAHQLDAANTPADKQRRADLLFRAAVWSDAATAYADVLASAAPDDTARNDAAERYALALTMAGATRPAAPPALPELPSRLLAVLSPEAPVAPPADAAIPAMRSALDRARLIEQLLEPAAAHQGS